MAEKENKLITLKGVHFYYTTVNSPTITKDAKDKGFSFDSENPHKNTEWVVKVAIKESTFKKLKKKVPKCTNFPHAKDYTQEEFKEEFHEDTEMPDMGLAEDEDIYLVKFSQKCSSKTGKVLTKPPCIGIKGRTHDTNGLEINDEIAIGNGSKGIIQVDPVDFGDNGVYLYPTIVVVTELIPYESNSSFIDEDALGIEDALEIDDEPEEEQDEFDDDDLGID